MLKWTLYTVKVKYLGQSHVWAKFAILQDAFIFVKMVKIEHPLWDVFVVEPKEK
jgi:hypothetical protein